MLRKNKNTYTMEEFEEMFNNTQLKALAELEEDMNKSTENKEVDPIRKLVFTLQNTMAMGALKKHLFNEEKEEE